MGAVTEAVQYGRVLLVVCGCLVDGRNVVDGGVLRGVVSDLAFRVVMCCGRSVVLWLRLEFTVPTDV